MNVVQPGAGFDGAFKDKLMAENAAEATARQVAAAAQQEAGPLQALVDLVPR